MSTIAEIALPASDIDPFSESFSDDSYPFHDRLRDAGPVVWLSKYGIHVCVGMMVARLEAELLFAAFAKRVKRFEFLREPIRRCNNTLRTFASLPVRAVC